MGPFLFTMVFLGLVIVAGIVISLRININGHRLPGQGRFKRVRRLRTIIPKPDGTTVEETISVAC